MELLGNIELFVEVARARGFRRAAEQLGMPNSTVSRRIAELEQRVGVRLFHRTTRKVELTEAGRAYFRRCEGLVAEARAAHEALQEVAERPGGTLRVSLPADLAITLLAAPLREFGERYPQIDFELDLSSRRVDLVADGFDLAIRLGEPPATPSTLVARRLGRITRELHASPAYLRHAPPLEQPADLARHACLLMLGSSPQPWTLQRGDETQGVTVSGRHVMNSLGLCRALAGLGLGVAPLGEAFVREEVRRGELQRVLPGWALPPLPVYAVTESRLLPSRVRLFADFIAATLGA